jgi:hypothetical protein
MVQDIYNVILSNIKPLIANANRQITYINEHKVTKITYISSCKMCIVRDKLQTFPQTRKSRKHCCVKNAPLASIPLTPYSTVSYSVINRGVFLTTFLTTTTISPRVAVKEGKN